MLYKKLIKELAGIRSELGEIKKVLKGTED